MTTMKKAKGRAADGEWYTVIFFGEDGTVLKQERFFCRFGEFEAYDRADDYAKENGYARFEIMGY